MSSLQLYTLAQVYMDSNLLAEESSVSVDRTTDAQQVKTVAKGFAGLSPGAPMMTIKVDNAVPSADFELNPGKFMKSLQVVEITIFAAGKSLTAKGFVIDDNFAGSVGTASKLSFTFIAPFEDWSA